MAVDKEMIKRQAVLVAHVIKRAKSAKGMEKRAGWASMIPYLLYFGKGGLSWLARKLLSQGTRRAATAGLGRVGRWGAQRLGGKLGASAAKHSAGAMGRTMLGKGGRAFWRAGKPLGIASMWGPMALSMLGKDDWAAQIPEWAGGAGDAYGEDVDPRTAEWKKLSDKYERAGYALPPSPFMGQGMGQGMGS